MRDSNDSSNQQATKPTASSFSLTIEPVKGFDIMIQMNN